MEGLKLDWVYGYRAQDTRDNIRYVTPNLCWKGPWCVTVALSLVAGRYNRRSDIIYPVASMVVILRKDKDGRVQQRYFMVRCCIVLRCPHPLMHGCGGWGLVLLGGAHTGPQ